MTTAGEDFNTRPVIEVEGLEGRDRYQLLTSLIVPRPIAWVSTRSSAGVANLAPFSYFTALSPTPMLLGISIGLRKGSPKDSLANIRESGGFCVNIVTERHLAAMNESSGEHPPDIDEFTVAGLESREASLIDAPYVAGCPAVFECRLFREMDLGPQTVFVVGEVVGVHLEPGLEFVEGSHMIDANDLRPVARLGGEGYAFLGQISNVARPALR